MTKLWEKIKGAGRWVKDKARKFWKGIVSLIIGGTVVALAATMITSPVIPSEIINGKLIEFPYADEDSGELFDSRTDKEVYGFWEEGFILKRLENKSGKLQVITSNMFATEGVELLGVSVLEKDVPYQITVNDYGTTTYDCSYYEYTNSTTTEGWVDEIWTDRIWIDKTCEKQEVIGTHQETRYKDVWNPLNLNAYDQQDYFSSVVSNNIKLKDRKGIDRPTKTFQFSLEEKEVKIFQIKIKVPRKTQGQVIFEDIGSEGGYGHLK